MAPLTNLYAKKYETSVTNFRLPTYILIKREKEKVMLQKMLVLAALCCFGFLPTNVFAQNGFGFNAGTAQGQFAGGAGLGGNGVCQSDDGTGLGLGLMLGFGDGTEPMPLDGTGFGAPINR